MRDLGDGKEGAVDAWVLELLAVVSLVELLEGSECWYPGPFQSVQLVDLLPQGMADLLQEGRGEESLVLLAEELCEEAVGVKGLISKEEKRQWVGHVVGLTWTGRDGDVGVDEFPEQACRGRRPSLIPNASPDSGQG